MFFLEAVRIMRLVLILKNQIVNCFVMHAWCELSVLLYDETFLWQLEFLAWQNILMPFECILLCQACIMCTIYLFRDAKFSLLSMTILSLFHWIVHYLFYQACKIFLFHSMWYIYFCFNWIAVCLLNTNGLFCLFDFFNGKFWSRQLQFWAFQNIRDLLDCRLFW